jgi:hypothetical protein
MKCKPMKDDRLSPPLRKAGFRLMQSKLMNIRTGQRWWHHRVICGRSQDNDPIAKLLSRKLLRRQSTTCAA